jgi:hypothetical protein
VILQLVCAASAALLAVWGLHRTRAFVAAVRAAPAPRSPSSTRTPLVTVQVPLFNEPLVARRVVDAVCALRWPALEVQILDDSTDETPRIVEDAVARARARGVDVTHLRRPAREGFKAGALAHGLERARGEIVAIFDADFVPAPDFLERTVPRFVNDPALDMLQARWGHLNRDESWLTRAQAVLLDTHFAVEQLGRSSGDRFFGFNGTAGLWRRRAIVLAGGWSARTLTEDLDLSLRAWLAGGKFGYVDDVAVPAELPASVHALRVQQHRWARGGLESARLHLPRVWRAPLPLATKLDVTLKLTQNFAFPLLFLFVATLPAAAWLRAASSSHPWPLDVIATGLGTLPALASFAWASRRRGRAWRRVVVDALLAIGVSAALSAHTALAAMEGLLGARPAVFRRTPKDGHGRSRERRGAGPIVVVELALASLHLGAAARLLVEGHAALTPFLVLCGGSLLAVASSSLVAGLRAPVEDEAHDQRAEDEETRPRGLVPLPADCSGEHRLVEQG